MAKKDDKQKNLSKYLTKIEAAEKHRDSSYKKLWTAAYKRWRNYVDQLEDKDRSNISIPYVYVQIETILPRLVETLFASRPYVSIKDRKQNSTSNAKSNEILLDYQQNEVMDFQEIFNTGLKDLCIYGTAIAFIGWKFQQKPVIKKELMHVTNTDPMTGKPMPMMDQMTGQPVMDWQPVEKNEITYDDPEVKFVDLGLFYVDPQAEDIDNARFCGHIEFKTKEELQELVDIGVYEIDWKKVEKQNNTNKARDYRMSAIGLPLNDDQSIDGKDDSLFEVLHYFEDDKHVVIINRSYVALDGASPFWHKRKPYKKSVYTEVTHEFYGMGVPEILGDLQDELNTERNMRIDFRSFLLRRMFKIRRGARIDKKQLKWRQGGYIEVDDLDDIQEFQVSDNMSSFTSESTIKQDMQDATGGHDVVMGTATDSTATSTMTKDNNASIRFKLVISRIEKKLLVGISRLMIQLNQQFLDNDRILRITGIDGQNDNFVQIGPGDIQGEFDLIAAGSSVEPLANKEAYKQRMVELYQVVSQDPVYMQYPDKRRNLLQKVLEAFDIKDIAQLLPSEQDLLIQQQQQMMAQQQQMAMQQQQAQDQNNLKAQEIMLKHGGYNKGQANTPIPQEQGQQMMEGR